MKLVAQIVLGVVLVGLVIVLTLMLGTMTTRFATEIEIIDAEPGVRCALAKHPQAVAINCWEIDE